MVERWVLGPLDGVRTALYRAIVPVLGPWIRSRDVRVALHGASVVAGAFLAAVIAPLLLLLVSPLVLGVPHLMADVRYLVAQPGLARRGVGWAAVGGLLLACAVTVDLRWGLLGAALAPWIVPGPIGRRVGVGAGLGALAATAWWAAAPTTVALAHIHNLVAVVLWLVVAFSLERVGAGGGVARWGVAGLGALGAVALLGGACDGWLAAGFGWASLGGLGLDDHAASLAPGSHGPWPARWVATFAFAQAVHYGIWLRVLPEDARDRPSPRTFRASWRALHQDLGGPLLVGSLAVFCGVAAWATIDLVAARAGYLRLALFHGPMELAILGAWLVQGRSFWRPDEPRA